MRTELEDTREAGGPSGVWSARVPSHGPLASRESGERASGGKAVFEWRGIALSRIRSEAGRGRSCSREVSAALCLGLRRLPPEDTMWESKGKE